MVLLENDQFLTELTKFYQKAKTSGTVLVTMKRYDGRTKPVSRTNKNKQTKKPLQPHPPEPQEYKCLFRATISNKKISTVITSKDMNRFQVAYSNLLKGNIELKKKEKEKNKTTAKSSSSKTSKATQ
jgi:signal recognition particle subunit SRP14